MAYIYENTNAIRVKCIELLTGNTYADIQLDANCTFDIKDSSKTYETWNHEIVIDNIGSRMIVTASIINRSEVNTQLTVLSLLDCINKVRTNDYIFHVWPSYDSTKVLGTLDVFYCTVDGMYDIKKIHEFIKSGTMFTVKFIELTPNLEYVPRIPLVSNNVFPFTSKHMVN